MTPFIDVATSDILADRGRRMGATRSLVTKHVGVADAGWGAMPVRGSVVGMPLVRGALARHRDTS
jgi:hypothetical protein